MTGKLGRPCREPRCPEIVTGEERYCEKHRASEESHRFSYRREDRNPFYKTAQWQRLREIVLSRDPMCQECKREASRVVHHIKQAREYPELRADLDNLEALCDRCHNRKSQEEQRQKLARAALNEQ